MTYTVKLATVAIDTHLGATAGQRAAFDELKARLAASPREQGTYNTKKDQYSADLGRHGLVLYTVHDANVTVAVWRIQFFGQGPATSGSVAGP